MDTMGAINAKVRAMSNRRLTDSQQYYDELERLRLFISDIQWRRILEFEREAYQTNPPLDYAKMWSFIKRLPMGQNRLALTYIKGTEIDLHNILRIYRLKRYYPEAEVYPHLIPVCYRLNKETLKQMAESPGIAEFIVMVRHSHYFDLSFGDLEEDIVRVMRRVFSDAVKRYPRSMAVVLRHFFSRRHPNGTVL